ncbi:MAG: fused MFS/spermidine synthase [Acidobacteriia bacterium]|nr:fused MFS/spermidine synthase [Terriglobia bacterium]
MSAGQPLSITILTSLKLRAILVLIGFTATVAQIVLMRELMLISYGNEVSLGVMLASWLLWTAIGSSLLGRLAARTSKPTLLMVALQTLLALLFPATVLAVRASRSVVHALPGELLGPWPIFLTCLLTLSCFCAASGWVFVAGSRLHVHESGSSTSVAVNSVYLLEAAGSALGGILAGLILLRSLNSLQIAFLVSTLNFMAAATLSLRRRSHQWIAVSALLVAWVLVGLPEGRRLETASLARLWPGFRLVDTRNSVYGNLAVLEAGGIRSLVENGLLMFNAPDPATAEESVHFALLEHPAPRSLLLIGGGAGGSLLQALQHPSLERVDYVELDPTVIELAQQYFREQWAAAQADPRVHVHHADGRLFLKTTDQAFDVIIVNLPAPQTAQLNRFYTSDFFREAAEKLADGGVFSFQLHAAEEYLSPDLSAFLRCVVKSLQEAFPVVRTIPGDTVHFFAAKREGVLAADPIELLSRLRSRHLQTSYVREYYIPFRVMPDRVADLEQKIHPGPDTPVNRDLAPIAYYFDVALWSTQFNREYQYIFESIAKVRFGRLVALAAALLFAMAMFICCWAQPTGQVRASAGFCIALAGLTMISLEVLLLLGFQAIYGYIYHELAILIALFMTGMALGSWWRLRSATRLARALTSRAGLMQLAGLQVLAAMSPVLLYLLLSSLAGIRSSGILAFVSQIVFPAMALLAGLLGGYEFALATEVFFAGSPAPQANMGMLYGIDLLGACVGTLVLSAFLLPLFGFLRAAIFIAVVNLAPAVLAVWVSRSKLESLA